MDIDAKVTPNNKSSLNIFSLFKNMFIEFFMLFKGLGLGLFSIADFIISFIVSFFSYLFWGITNILNVLWKWGFELIIMEIYSMYKAVICGIGYIIRFIVIEIPLFIYNKAKKPVKNSYTYVKDQAKVIKDTMETGKTFGNTVKEYFKDKYSNLSYVKEAQAKKEASLSILTINQSGADAEKTATKKTYRYVARNKEGALISGYFAALSRLDVYSYLIDEGMIVYEIETSWSINLFHSESTAFKAKMTHKDLIFWLTQLSTYIKAGIPLAEAVKILAQQDKRRKYKGVYEAVIYELTMGNSFSDSLNKQGSVFPALLINMIKSSELIGNIEGTLDEMSDYYQDIEDTKKAIIAAVTYPVMVLVFALAVVVFLLVYIIPQFVSVYESMDAELNPITLFTLSVSNYLKTEWKTILVVVFSTIVIFAWLFKNIKAFKTFIQFILMKLPVIGKIIKYKELSIFARTFATLNKNNVLLTDSIDILRKITNNEIYKSIMMHTINNLLKGEKMSVSFKDHWAIPDVAYYMIVTGESTGELSTMLERVGEYYLVQEKNMVSQIKTFIEPVLICLLAIVVGFILISVIIPMFGIYNTIK